MAYATPFPPERTRPPGPGGRVAWGADESTHKPDPVPAGPRGRRVAAIHLGLPSPAHSSGLPAGSGGQPSNACADASRRPLGLAPGGVYLAIPVTRDAGGLLHHPFTLTRVVRTTRAVCSLWHCPAGHPGLPLTTTLPCGVRTFLGGGSLLRRGRPADSSARSSVRPPRSGLCQGLLKHSHSINVNGRHNWRPTHYAERTKVQSHPAR